MARKPNAAQAQIPGTEPPAKRERNGPLSIGAVVQRLIDLDSGFAAEVEEALDRVRAKFAERLATKRTALLARLPSDVDRETAERVARAALGALRPAGPAGPAVTVEQLGLLDSTAESSA